MQQAGADALELNIYDIPTDMDLSSAQVEATYLDILTAVRSVVHLPIAVKLSAFFTHGTHGAPSCSSGAAAWCCSTVSINPILTWRR